MIDPTNFKDYRTYLKTIFASRQHENSSYSLRKFSKDLGISAARLSEILSSKCGISMATTVKISKALNLDIEEQDYFFDLVRSRHSISKALRNEAKKRIQVARRKNKTKVIRSASLELLSRWHFVPLIEALTLTEALPDQRLKEMFGLNDLSLADAKSFLLRSGLLSFRKDGGYVKADPHYRIESPVPSKVIQDFHRDYLHRAQSAVTQPIDQKKFLTTYLPVKKKKIDLARKELAAFHENFIRKYSSVDGDSVYSFAIQLFKVE